MGPHVRIDHTQKYSKTDRTSPKSRTQRIMDLEIFIALVPNVKVIQREMRRDLEYHYSGA